MSLLADADIELLRDILREAGETEIMPRFRTLASGDVTEKKSSIDLVTDADLLAEKRITARLRDRFPGALIVGEEASETNPGLIAALADADLAFAIDPVDGTFNFASGLPVFGTILAVVSKGETIAGLIHDPVLGDTLVASKGAGARVLSEDGDEAVARVIAPRSIDSMVGTISINDIDRSKRQRIAGNLGKIKDGLRLQLLGLRILDGGHRQGRFHRPFQADAVGPSGRCAGPPGSRRLFRQARWHALSARRDHGRHSFGAQ
jgi:fructose-1,6-bisphosphatase/inositol monophosphatase family enzyme